MVGREKEQNELLKAYRSQEPSLVVVYGRRRVGKTYLVTQTFSNSFAFFHAGVSPDEMENVSDSERLAIQLKAFRSSLVLSGASDCPLLKDWQDAFLQLELLLEKKKGSGKLVVFLDETPWMDTPNSHFISAFESYWNSYACRNPGLLTIVCGSAISWIVNKLLHNKRGLYGRATKEILLPPFSLKETEEFLLSRDIRLSRYDIVRIYMALGGIPYYLGYLESGMTVAENIDALFFGGGSPLRVEFDSLFRAIFDYPVKAEAIVRALSKKNIGLSRDEILEKTSQTDGGTFSSVLKALERSGFILSYTPLNREGKELFYKLVDPFCLFYIKHVENAPSLNPSFWQGHVVSDSIRSYRGLAFENVCFHHIPQIKRALGVERIESSQYPYLERAGENRVGSQIDLVIYRADNFVNLCEMKFYGDDYEQQEQDHKGLERKIASLAARLPKKASIHPILVTTFGLLKKGYYSDFERVITLDDLFC